MMPAQKLTIVNKCLFSFFLLTIFLAFVDSSVVSQAASGVATTYEIADLGAKDGDIICLYSEEKISLRRCQKSYDENIYGVFVLTPQVVLRLNADEKPIVTSGSSVLVNVSDGNGKIKPGDPITSSEVAGVGQKATDYAGVVLGQALAPFPPEAETKPNAIHVGKVLVGLSIGTKYIPTKTNLLDKLGLILVSNVQKPDGAALFIRYVTAGLVTILTTLFALNSFGRNITKGVESVGRNPLAKNQIQVIVIINTLLVAAVTVGGIILSLAIIRL